MQRIFHWFIILVALYVSAGCSATHAPIVPEVPSPESATAPITGAPAPEVTTAPVTPALSPNAVPHIALLLPLRSPNPYLAKAAEAVKEGFVAAYRTQPGMLPVRIYGMSDENSETVAAYRQAVKDGAQIIVGPLTHIGVSILTSKADITVPTLALNNIDNANHLDNLYFFGLSLEEEARQVARQAIANDLHTASIVAIDTPLSQRLVQAFSDEWKKQGGEIAVVKTFDDDPNIFTDLPIDLGSMVFVASTANKARLFRPYLNAVLPVYSTSQIFDGNSNQIVNYDLRDIHFVDMPWLLEPDNPVVMKYPHFDPPQGVDMERLYALGIDAYRLMQIIHDNRFTALPLDGVTGAIHLDSNHQFVREAIAAQFKQGLGLTPEAYSRLNDEKKQ